ncbi:hypothetical protein L9F63_025206, partial [Diploptera punctata]
MPFMKGKAPIRRTLKYLQSGSLVFKDRVKVFCVNYNTQGLHHEGAREFVFWYLPQIQYKNPDVQVLSVKNVTPSPFITCFFENGEKMLVDMDSKTKEEVHDHLKKVICKPEMLGNKETTSKETNLSEDCSCSLRQIYRRISFTDNVLPSNTFLYR